MSLSKLLKAARENVEAEGTVLTPEQVAEQEVALADTGITVDVIDEVQAPAADLEIGMGDIDAIEVEADSLATTAAALDESLATDGPSGGQGVDPVAAGIVADQIQSAVERFGLDFKTTRPARESFGTSQGKRDVTRSLAREAEAASAGMRERAVAAIKKAVEWLRALLASVFDQATRIENRAKALVTKARGSKAAGGQELKLNASFLGTKSASDTARGLTGLTKNLAALGAAVTDVSGSSVKDVIDLNPDMVGNVALRVDFTGDKAVFVKEQGEGGDAKAVGLAANVAGTVANEVASAVGKLKASKAAFDAVTKNSLSLIGALKSDGSTADRAAAVASVSAVTRGAGAVVSLGMSTASRLLDLVDQSLNVKAAAEPAGAAA